jgi:hypothetical protein
LAASRAASVTVTRSPRKLISLVRQQQFAQPLLKNTNAPEESLAHMTCGWTYPSKGIGYFLLAMTAKMVYAPSS